MNMIIQQKAQAVSFWIFCVFFSKLYINMKQTNIGLDIEDRPEQILQSAFDLQYK